MFARLVSNPELHAECRRTWAALSTWARAPAGEDGVARVVGSRFALFPQPERSDGEWAAWWADYYAALEDLPEEALEGAMRAYVREVDAEFLPKPGRLRELALTMPTKRARMAALVARAAAYEPAKAAAYAVWVEAPRLPQMLTAGERKREVEAAREVCRQLKATAESQPRPKVNWSVPPTDERGLTEAMRKKMGVHAPAERGEG